MSDWKSGLWFGVAMGMIWASGYIVGLIEGAKP